MNLFLTQRRRRLLPALDRFLERMTMTQRERLLQPTVTEMQRGVRSAFERQGRRLIERSRILEGARLREAFTSDDWLSLFDLVTGETEDLFFTPLQTGIQAALTLGARQVVAQVAVEYAFGLRNPRAVAYLEDHGYGLISQIDAVTRGNIATIVDNALAEGWSYSKTAREISALYREMAVGVPQRHLRSRAELIAVTETGNAYEAGNEMVVRDLADGGLRMEKQWLTVGDDRVSDGCQANQDEGWIPAEQAFSSGHMRPLRFPGCRCTTLYRRRPS